MITRYDLEWRWKHRGKYIYIGRYILDELEVEYAVQVLEHLRIPPADCYLTDNQIIHTILDYYEQGESPVECAGDLLDDNRVIGEYA